MWWQTIKGKTIFSKQNSGNKLKLSERNRWDILRIVKKEYKTLALKVTRGLKNYLENFISTKTVYWELQKAGFLVGAAIRKSMLSNKNKKKRLEVYWIVRN